MLDNVHESICQFTHYGSAEFVLIEWMSCTFMYMYMLYVHNYEQCMYLQISLWGKVVWWGRIDKCASSSIGQCMDNECICFCFALFPQNCMYISRQGAKMFITTSSICYDTSGTSGTNCTSCDSFIRVLPRKIFFLENAFSLQPHTINLELTNFSK